MERHPRCTLGLDYDLEQAPAGHASSISAEKLGMRWEDAAHFLRSS